MIWCLGRSTSLILSRRHSMSRMWVTVTAMATVFTIAAARSSKVARTVLGDKEDQVVGSDRFSAYNWIWAFWRQICWSHLRRDFQAMIDRHDEGSAVGSDLLGASNRLFHWWHRYCHREIAWSTFLG